MNKTQISVEKPQNVCNFLMDSLGFTYCENATAEDGRQGILAAPHEKADYGLFLVKATAKRENQVIVIPTEDCLRDYYELLCKGLEPEVKPFYTELGLELNLTDPSGNEYRLLEKRDYAET